LPPLSHFDKLLISPSCARNRARASGWNENVYYQNLSSCWFRGHGAASSSSSFRIHHDAREKNLLSFARDGIVMWMRAARSLPFVIPFVPLSKSEVRGEIFYSQIYFSLPERAKKCERAFFKYKLFNKTTGSSQKRDAYGCSHRERERIRASRLSCGVGGNLLKNLSKIDKTNESRAKISICNFIPIEPRQASGLEDGGGKQEKEGTFKWVFKFYYLHCVLYWLLYSIIASESEL
jgi:hypothetical protein